MYLSQICLVILDLTNMIKVKIRLFKMMFKSIWLSLLGPFMLVEMKKQMREDPIYLAEICMEISCKNIKEKIYLQ